MDKIASFIEEQLAAWEVPGCAVVAIKDGEIVLNSGFGLRDVEQNKPVTTKSLFQIGSTTKAFTCAGVGAMVDDGLVEWETPLREYIPGFKMHDPVATERITVLDLLCHRSGLPRHDLAWIGRPDWSRAELVQKLRYFPLSRDIRQTFQYCNLGYVTAGHLIEVVTGLTWEDWLSTRLLKPLGMDRSNFSVHDSQASDDYSKPYERRQGKVVEIPFRTLDAAGPAGSINSCTDDMAQWLAVNLGGGKLGDDQIISPDTMGRQTCVQMGLPEQALFPEATSFGYGLGWGIGQYRGRRVVEHNGGIDGSLTECKMLPNDGIGVVVLTNSSSSMMGPVIANRVIDELLGEEPIDWFTRFKEVFDAMVGGEKDAKQARPRVEGAKPPRPLAEYAGSYEHPGYGPLSIELQGDELIPTFGTLKVALVHRHYDVFDLEWRELSEDSHVFPLTFLTDPNGDVVGFTVPLETECDPIRFDRKADVLDAKTLEKLTGIYEMGPIEVVIALKGDGTLTASTAGGPAAELVASRGLRFGVKDQPTVSAEFVLGADGEVEKIVLQPMGILTPKR